MFKNKDKKILIKTISAFFIVVISHLFLSFEFTKLIHPLWVFLWMYVGIPVALIGLTSNESNSKDDLSQSAYWGKIALTFMGCMVLLILWFLIHLSVLVFGPETPVIPVWVWNCMYYVLLLLIWQPNAFGRGRSWVKGIFWILFLLLPVLWGIIHLLSKILTHFDTL